MVSRPRLIARLNEGRARKLTVLSAPAGFGKSTLLAEWLAGAPASERPVAWVSLDLSDNDPALFAAYVVAALQTMRPRVAAHAHSLLQSLQPPPIESVLGILINELAAIEDQFTLVLDDLHVIDSQPVHNAITYLLDHLPPRMHVVIASRSDPPLPLARLRGRGELIELRAADLRFTPDEAAAFLSGGMGLTLSADDIAALENRTEGWIAGLQLAGLSMRGRDDIPGFIAAFAGDNHYIVDYLIEEVLQRQPEQIRSFLLATAMLDRLSGPLCDAVTGQSGGREMLAALDRSNLFVVPLDDKRQWYRYHHLFADVLRVRAAEEEPDRLLIRHRQASEWHQQAGDSAQAIRHALAGGDAARAADLIELAVPAMRRNRQETTLRGWLRALPDELYRDRPVLSVAAAGTLLSSGELESAETRLRDAELWLDTTAPHASSARMVVVDEEEFRRLPGSIAVFRAAHALVLGNVADTVSYAQRALDLVAEDDHMWRGPAFSILGLAAWTNGDLEMAHRSHADGLASLLKAGFVTDAVGGVVALADIRITQGRLRDAMRTYERALRLAKEQGEPVLRGTADMYVGLSALHFERGDLDVALNYLQTSKALGEHTGFPQFPYRWRVAMARLRESAGDLDGALDLLDEAERRYVADFLPNARPIAALRARVWIAQGRLDDAMGWAREQGLSIEDELSYLREFEHITLARMLIAQYTLEQVESSIHEASGLLERLLDAAQSGGRIGNVIEILTLQALAEATQGNTARASALLERALTLAEPEGYVRIFVHQGTEMRDILRHAVAKGIASSYPQRLLGAFTQPVRTPSTPARASVAALAEPLTAREIEILRLIAAGLRNQEIADRLFISLPTVKRHIANAYGKLGAGHRTEALARATALNLL